METCPICLAIASPPSLAPGLRLYQGRYWVVDHAYPAAAAGRLIIALKRHAEALSELSDGELEELAALQTRCAQALLEVFGCDKTYAVSQGDPAAARHQHYQVMARAAGPAPAADPAATISPAEAAACYRQLLPFFEG